MNISTPHFFFLTCTAIYLIIRGYFQKRVRKNNVKINKKNTLDRLLILSVIAGQILIPLLFIFAHLLNFAAYALPNIANLTGYALSTCGLWLFWRSHSDLGESWSVALEVFEQHKLITNGVYRYIRHPMYASFFLLALGQGLLLNNWLAGWAALVAVGLLYIIRKPNEEQMMIETFGGEYVSYMKKSGGIVPRF